VKYTNITLKNKVLTAKFSAIILHDFLLLTLQHTASNTTISCYYYYYSLKNIIIWCDCQHSTH